MALSTRNQQTSAGLADVEPAFFLSDDVERRADDVIAEHEAFRELRDLSIAWCLKTKRPTKEDPGIDDLCRAIVVGEPWHSLTDYDVVVWVSKYEWDHLGRAFQRGALTHALSHVMTEVDEKTGATKVVKVDHDVEAFLRETNKLGPWSERLARLWRSFGRDPKAEQATVEEAVERAVEELDGAEIRIGDNVAHIRRGRGTRGRAE